MSEGLALEERRSSGTATFVLVVAVPLAVGLLVAWAVYQALPATTSLLQRIIYWIMLSLVAILSARGFERLAMHLMPLRVLTRLSMQLDDRRLDQAARASEGEAPIVPPELHATATSLMEKLADRDGEAAMHARRTGAIVDLLAEEVGLGPPDRLRLVWAARLRPAVMAVRPQQSTASVLGPLAPWLGEYVVAIDDATEHFDGTGLPHGLAGDEINLGARLMAVTVAYDMAVQAAPHRGDAEGRAHVAELAGTQLDPSLVRAFLALPVKRVRALVGPLATSAVPGTGFRIDLLTAATSVGAPVAAVGAGVIAATLLAGQVAAPVPTAPIPEERPFVAAPALPEHDADASPASDVTDEPSEEPSEAPPPAAPAPAVEAEVLGIQIVRPVDRPVPTPSSVPPKDDPVADVSEPAAPVEPTPTPSATPSPTPTPSPTATPSTSPTSSPVPVDAAPPPSSPPPVPAPEPEPTPTPQEPPSSPPSEDGPLVVDVVGSFTADGDLLLSVVITNVSDTDITGIRALVNPPQDGGDAGAAQHDVGSLAPGASVTIVPEGGTSGGTNSAATRVVVTVTADGLLPIHAIVVVRAHDPDTILPPQPPTDPPAVEPVHVAPEGRASGSAEGGATEPPGHGPSAPQDHGPPARQEPGAPAPRDRGQAADRGPGRP